MVDGHSDSPQDLEACIEEIRNLASVQACMTVGQYRCNQVVNCKWLQKHLKIFPVIYKREQRHHLPESPFDRDTNGAHSLIESIFRGG